MSAQLITLEQWLEARYAVGCRPTIGTARRWANNGNICPPPEKNGRAYYVSPNAVYTSGKATPQLNVAQGERRAANQTYDVPRDDVSTILAYKNISRDTGLEFAEWGELTPNEWLEKHRYRFFLDIEQIRLAKRPIDSLDRSLGTGVYFLFTDDRLSYIGQSVCIPSRLDQHRYRFVGDNPAAWITHYTAIWVPKFFLNKVEYSYIQMLRPPRNVRMA